MAVVNRPDGSSDFFIVFPQFDNRRSNRITGSDILDEGIQTSGVHNNPQRIQSTPFIIMETNGTTVRRECNHIPDGGLHKMPIVQLDPDIRRTQPIPLSTRSQKLRHGILEHQPEKPKISVHQNQTIQIPRLQYPQKIIHE